MYCKHTTQLDVEVAYDFSNIDDTLVNFKRAEEIGVKAFYKQHKNSFEIDEEELYKYWAKI